LQLSVRGEDVASVGHAAQGNRRLEFAQDEDVAEEAFVPCRDQSVLQVPDALIGFSRVVED